MEYALGMVQTLLWFLTGSQDVLFLLGSPFRQWKYNWLLSRKTDMNKEDAAAATTVAAVETMAAENVEQIADKQAAAIKEADQEASKKTEKDAAAAKKAAERAAKRQAAADEKAGAKAKKKADVDEAKVSKQSERQAVAEKEAAARRLKRLTNIGELWILSMLLGWY